MATVALDAGLSLPYVANLENGRGNPTFDTLVRLATALDVSVADLVAEPTARELAQSTSALPPALLAFARTDEFADACARVAAAQQADEAELRTRIIRALAACPTPRGGAPARRNYQRLLDAIVLTLG